MNEAEPNQNMEQKCPQCGAPLPSGVLAGLCPACLFKQGAAADTAVPPDAPPFQPPSVEELGKLFPQLEIMALLGKGGMGAVYQARQPGLDRIVALKILPAQTAGGPGFVERFNREARALAKLNHPNIVAVYEFGQAGGLPFFIMEFVDGLNLRQLERAGKLSPAEALHIVPQICEALQFAHDEGIVHRDIKPENILLDKKGRVKIADFGIAKILGAAAETDLTGTQGAIGTPHYMAPEQMEKPLTVDHRADIFSLGVVFYEMLTGELPLGKFAPPSSRKVEVDVRLDEVVLRALEKDPERRYQHASQVKTAVDTIANHTAPPPGATGAALAEEILAKDYTLNIRSCVRRGWKLLKGEFWPFVGITALFMALLAFASSMGGAVVRHGPAGDNSSEISSAVAMLVWGPLMGGLMFYFLKKLRCEPATVETAFCGFSAERFLHLFLAGFVTSLLTGLGFFLVLPGIYLTIAWMFTLPLVMDKRLDFWSAMELSRKVVTKHWFKFLGFGIVLLLLTFAGVLMLVVGLFVMSPLILASLMHAYEDVFGGATGAAPPPIQTGPHGTVVTPAAPPQPPRETWGLTTKIGLAVVAVALGILVVSILIHSVREHHRQQEWEQQAAAAQEQAAPPMVASAAPEAPPGPTAPAEPVEPPAVAVDHPVFGPVVDQVLTNLSAINLASGKMESLPASVTEQNRGPDKDTAACAWMEHDSMDFAYVGDYDGFYSMTRDLDTLKRDDWDSASPESVGTALQDSGQDVAAKFGEASRLENPTNYTFGFRTRDGSVGLLQFIGYTDNPRGAQIRYKLVPRPEIEASAVTTDTRSNLEEELNERLDAASNMSNDSRKDKLLAIIATDAANSREVDIVKNCLAKISNQEQQDKATRNTAMLLAKHGLRKEGIELATSINNPEYRDAALAELAQQNLPDTAPTP
jgi:predicted Ser/Thr protein kinase